MLEISVLGPLEARRAGDVVPLPGGKSAELLVRLALEAGDVVRTDRLIEDLWAGEVGIRRNTLQSKVTRLRRSLGDPAAIVGTAAGYRLAVEPSHVDAHVVARDAVTAGRLLVAGDDRSAVEVSGTALARFAGDLLPAGGDGDWVVRHRVRLDETRTNLIETHFAARLGTGEADDLIGELEAAVGSSPYQEALWQLLITALYRSGRQADALAAYQRVRALLADELGLEPGPLLRQVEQQILVHDASLGGVESARWSSGVSTGNLPSLAAGLVGRDRDVDALSDLVADHRLVAIVGPGGVGKTALAICAGRSLAATNADAIRAVWLARLEAAADADEVGDVLVAALGITSGDAALFERLRASTGLLILDNCEHVVEPVAALALRLLDAAPELRILCTSQVPLGVDGEVVYELAPLELSDAIELFMRRAAGQRPNRSAPEAPDSVRALCRSLDGLPLAIELAAARTKTLPIDEITRRLDDRFILLRDPTSRKPERRRALKATIGWSYDLLFPDDQRGLWALATFAGGASLPAVEFVLEEALEVPASAAIDVVGRLASRSLVIIDDDSTGMSFRYRLLDSIRAFALDAAVDAGLADRASAAHARWLADVATASTDGVRSSRQGEYLAVARMERANIDAALSWASANDPLLGLEITNGFGWAWVVLGDSRGAQRILAALDSAGAGAPARERAAALLLAAWIEASTGDLGPARTHVARAGELAEAIGDVDLQARAWYYLAYIVSHHGDFAHALDLTARSDALYQDLDRPWDQAANWLFASRAAISAADHPRSVEARDQVLHWLSMVDDPWLHARGEAMLGELARLEGRFGDAVLHIGRAAEQSRQLGFLQTEAYQVSSLGRAQCQAGDYETGARTLEHAIEKAEATGDVRLAALARVHLGRVLRALGRTADAREALEAACAWHRTAGGGEQHELGECLLAALDAVDHVEDAAERLSSICETARADGEAHVEVFALDALARLAAQTGDVEAVHALVEEADERMTVAAHFISERDRVDAHAVRQPA